MKDYTENKKSHTSFKEGIIFPALNLTIEEWNFNTLNDVKLEGQFYFGSNSSFNTYYLESLFVDTEGNLYKIIGKEDFGKWRKFIPFFMKSKIIFEDLNTQMILEDVIAHVVYKVNTISYSMNKNKAFQIDWIEKIKQSKSIKQLLNEHI